MVRLGVVRALDKDVTDGADAAADRGRRHFQEHVLDGRRLLHQACQLRYLFHDLHRSFIALTRTAVDTDGRSDTALDQVVWSAGSLLEGHRIERTVRNIVWLLGSDSVWAVARLAVGSCHRLGYVHRFTM